MEITRRGMWKKIGDGNCTLFWMEAWFADQNLKDKFSMIFSISLQQGNKIADMGQWNNGI